MTIKECLYDIRESVKALNIDSDLTDRQILFLVRLFRSLVIRQHIATNPGENREMLSQTLHMELELVDSATFPQYGVLGTTLLRTVKELPNIVGPMMYKHIEIRGASILGAEIEFINKSRAIDILYAPKNFIYAFRDVDGKLYLISKNVQYKNLLSVDVTAILENPEEIQNIHDSTEDLEVYPITTNLWILVKDMVIGHVVKEMSIPIDTISDKKDDQLAEKTSQ